MAIQGTHSPEREDKAPTERNFPLLRGPPASGVKGREREPSHSRVRATRHSQSPGTSPLAECLVPGDTFSCLNSESRLA